ncbi:TPMT family class I SAM-dependent methyltransferase [Winogradskyella alexanderae]|uniref:TPMT family class I SAM-dependent methyltransferase n=1 Tax=Winogradskyella alexanderae TaxID=2877123 RepID=A0ABS7XQT9_9FLAO|nr:TPMT family class I SAM-dependent methyltransferase [Winogradskyella alexanderae]MCA0132363.1 TPMT family class I SAM-dependent methyltransferase [Winogradskyella alexanderae]
MKTLNKEYWDNRYEENKTGWNIGYISTPIKAYIDQLTDKSVRILIPGAGNSYEAEYLWKNGFKNVFVIDIAKIPLQNLKSRVPDFPLDHLIHDDFFDYSGSFDLIIEQTFFCALSPNLRSAYANKTLQLLKPQGKIVGLLFNFPLSSDGPPFGGSEKEYNQLFIENYTINILEPAINSIKERQGKELFFIFEKKDDLN